MQLRKTISIQPTRTTFSNHSSSCDQCCGAGAGRRRYFLVGAWAGAGVKMWRKKHFIYNFLAYFIWKRAGAGARAGEKKVPVAGAGQKRTGFATLHVTSANLIWSFVIPFDLIWPQQTSWNLIRPPHVTPQVRKPRRFYYVVRGNTGHPVISAQPTALYL